MKNRTLVAYASLTWLALVASVGSTPQTRADTIVPDQKYTLFNNLVVNGTSDQPPFVQTLTVGVAGTLTEVDISLRLFLGHSQASTFSRRRTVYRPQQL
jgi:hypothetical protein